VVASDGALVARHFGASVRCCNMDCGRDTRGASSHRQRNTILWLFWRGTPPGFVAALADCRELLPPDLCPPADSRAAAPDENEAPTCSTPFCPLRTDRTPHLNGRANPSEIRIAPTCRPLALSMPHRRRRLHRGVSSMPVPHDHGTRSKRAPDGPRNGSSAGGCACVRHLAGLDALS
jgi:hypothetical protein